LTTYITLLQADSSTEFTNIMMWSKVILILFLQKLAVKLFVLLQKPICTTLSNVGTFWKMYTNDTLCISCLKQPSTCILGMLYTEIRRYLSCFQT